MMRWMGLGILSLALAACGVSSEETYEVTGVVEFVDIAEKQVRIAHDDIPGFMPAMTMNFDVVSEALLTGLEPGTQVHFHLERSATSLRITAIQPTGEVAGVSVASGPPPELDIAPDFELTDQRGESFALQDLRGSCVLLDFVFTRCQGPCPILTAAHAELQQKLPAPLASRTHFVSVSLDPGYDNPERLRKYGETRGADLERWSFLTGPIPDVQEVLDAYHIGRVRQEDGTLDHLVVTYLIDPEGKIARRYLGLEHSSEEILADLSKLLK